MNLCNSIDSFQKILGNNNFKSDGFFTWYGTEEKNIGEISC